MPGNDLLLTDKTGILVQQDRELSELRVRIDQLSAWLALEQTLPELFLNRGESLATVWERVRRTILAKLRLQRVLLFEVRAGTLRALAPVGPDRCLAVEARLLLGARPSGLCNDPKPGASQPGVAALADALGLHQFTWGRVSGGQGSLILIAGGFDSEKAAFQSPFSNNEAILFGNLAKHIELLLANALLSAEAEREKDQLRQAYLTLEQEHQALRKTVEDLTAAANRALK
jgi:hypothetical protein